MAPRTTSTHPRVAPKGAGISDGVHNDGLARTEGVFLAAPDAGAVLVLIGAPCLATHRQEK